MSRITVPYGKTHLSAALPDGCPVEIIAPRDAPAPAHPAQLVEAALATPLGGIRLSDSAGVRSAVVVISDKTRPLPALALAPLLTRLEALGLPPDAITLLVGTGTHAPMGPGEFPALLPPDVLGRYRVISHDCDDAANLIHKGTTSRGTDVWVNRAFDEADLRVVTGNLNPHQFMGFSGGAKAAAIGVAGRVTINQNHARMVDPLARLGEYERNPARQDVEEIGRMMGIHFALNVILNTARQIVAALAGDPVAVMEAGIPLVRSLVQVPVAAPFDLVITSPGGHPKDINLYQAQKALGHASLIVEDGGTVILAGACPEGTGSASYEAWMEGMTSHQAVLDRFAREEFCLGPHKAFQIARDAVRARVIVVSEMADDRVCRLLLTPARDLQAAVDMALADLPPGARIGVLPAANSTVPVLAPGG
jgi:nickel-dependent lactate racemase